MGYKNAPIADIVTQDLTAPLSQSYEMTKAGWLEWVAFNGGAAITETVTVTLDSVDGAAYDTVLDTSNLSGAQYYFFNPAKAIRLRKGDIVKVTVTSATATSTCGLTIMIQEGETWES